MFNIYLMNRMNIFKTALLVLLLVCAGGTYAQIIGDPTTWTYEVKQKGVDKYDLVFHLSLKPGWHIWSLHPGGDGLQIAPSFVFTDSATLHRNGKVKETGKPQVKVMEGIDGKVTLFADKVDYVQSVTVKGKAKISGTHLYQVCNETICLPPKTKDFVFDIK